jgi:hypothetical protein
LDHLLDGEVFKESLGDQKFNSTPNAVRKSLINTIALKWSPAKPVRWQQALSLLDAENVILPEPAERCNGRRPLDA